MKPLTPLEVIDLVVETYVKNPDNRSLSPVTGNCVYNGPEGQRCAFSRFVMNPEVLIEGEKASFQLTQGLPKLYREVEHITDPNFWNDVQAIHDGYAPPKDARQALGIPDSTVTNQRLFNKEAKSYHLDRVEAYVKWLKKKYADYNPESVQSGE